MKNLVLIVLLVLMSVFAFASSAQAEPAYVPVTPKMVGADICEIPLLPAGAKMLNVQLYNDFTGMRPKNLGPVSRFPLKPGEGFNFTWEGKEPNDGRQGTYWQLITPRTVPGAGLRIVCFEGGRDCKYERPQ